MSAMALRTYLSCPLRFRYRYLDNLYWSSLWGTSPEERKAVEKGQNFHLMARRYYAGIDPAEVADPVEQAELQSWLIRLQGFLPLSFDQAFYPELELRLTRPEMKLMAKFDLLVVDPDGRATIYDWKTTKRMPRRDRQRRDLQTIIYRYMLCAAGGQYSPRGQFKPEEVAMVYWNPLHEAHWPRFAYSQAQYERDEAYLQGLVQQILRTPRELFVGTSAEATCRSCEYRMICHGRRMEREDQEEEEELLEETLSWDNLPELP